MADPARPPPTFGDGHRFEVRRQVGVGSMGVVYEAFDREQGAVVALKTLRYAAPESVYRLKREFRALAGISHPNLVTLHELHVGEQGCFFTMELVRGVDFFSFVRARATPAGDDAGAGTDERDTQPLSRPKPGPLDEARLRAALAQLARGVHALHQAGRVHRDLKPSNVLVTDAPRVVLVDFGIIAELGARPGGQADLIGTPGYMAPEQANAMWSPASDWYAVGVMLFEALAGTLPFLGTAKAVAFDKALRDAPDVRALAPDAPADLATLCTALLRRDPASRPAPEAILAVLDPTPAPAAPAPAEGVELLGREGELDRLREALRQSRQGRGLVVHLHAASGMGKSQLAAAFLAEAERDGAVVLAGRCYEQESVPYKAVDSLVDALSRYLEALPRHEADAVLPRDVLLLARLFPVLMRVDAVAGARRRRDPEPELSEVRRRGFAALRELLARVAEARPVVVFIDDLHWGDVDSAPLLDGLMRPPDAPSLLLLLAYRSDEGERSALLRALSRRRDRLGPAANVMDLPLGPLPEDAARRLASAMFRAVGVEHAAQAALIARESGGVPFLLQELALAARARSDGASVSLAELVGNRLAQLPADERLCVELAAVAGKPVPQRVLAGASGLPEAQVAAAVRRLAGARLLRSSGESVECYHDRTRRAVVDGLGDDDRRRRHTQLASALAAQPNPDLEALVVHHQAAGQPDRAADCARRAAELAEATLAFDRAAELYRSALALGSFDEAEQRRLRARLAGVLGWAGRSAESAEAYLQAVAGASDAEQLELRRLASNQYLRAGFLDEGLRVLDTVLREVGLERPATPTRALAALLYERARVRLRGLGWRRRDASRVAPYDLARVDICFSVATDLGLVDTIAGAAFGTQMLRLALALGEPTRVCRALGVEAMFVAAQGRRSRRRAETIIARGRALAAELGDIEVTAWMDAAAGMLAYQQGHFRAASEHTQACTRRMREECTGLVWEVGSAEAQALWALFYLGEWRELSRRVDALLEQARQRGNRFDETNLCTGLPAIVWLAADRLDDARAAIDDAMSRWPPRGFHLQHYYEMLARAHCDLYAGGGAAARARIAAAWPGLERSQLLRLPSVAIEARHARARAAIVAGRPGEAEAALRAIERHHESPWARAVAALLRAGMATDAASAAPLLDAAIGRCERAEMALFAAAARRRRGELLGDAAGQALIEGADAAMSAQAVVAPERIARLLVPMATLDG